MKHFENILLACDGHGCDEDISERSPLAQKKNGDPLTLVSVSTP